MKDDTSAHKLNIPVALLFMTCALWVLPSFGQVDADVLRAKYGPPVTEIFDLRPGIKLSVIYGEKHQVCTLEIRPTPNASVIPAALVEEIVNEVIPPFTRGALKNQGTICLGSCWNFTQYENLTVDQTANDVTPNPDAPVQNWLAVVQMKSCKEVKQ
jgi:hypothetical protein